MHGIKWNEIMKKDILSDMLAEIKKEFGIDIPNDVILDSFDVKVYADNKIPNVTELKIEKLSKDKRISVHIIINDE